jgi:hypothetical protein
VYPLGVPRCELDGQLFLAPQAALPVRQGDASILSRTLAKTLQPVFAPHAQVFSASLLQRLDSDSQVAL